MGESTEAFSRTVAGAWIYILDFGCGSGRGEKLSTGLRVLKM